VFCPGLIEARSRSSCLTMHLPKLSGVFCPGLIEAKSEPALPVRKGCAIRGVLPRPH